MPSTSEATSVSRRSIAPSPTRSRRRATLRASEAQLRQAQIDLGYTQITAPFDGRIGRSVYSVGQWVGPDSGVLATLVKLDPIYVVFNVSERSYLDYQKQVDEAVRAGRPRPEHVPRLRLSNGAEYPYPGRFDFVDNRVDPSTGRSPFAPSFPIPTSCWCRAVRHSRAAVDGAEAGPAGSAGGGAAGSGRTFRAGGRTESRAEVRRIETGARVGINWEVTSGLAEGERVIHEGLQKVQPGSVVAPTGRPPAAPAG